MTDKSYNNTRTYYTDEERTRILELYDEYPEECEEELPKHESVHNFCTWLRKAHDQELNEGTMKGWLTKRDKKNRKTSIGRKAARTKALPEETKIEIAKRFSKFRKENLDRADSYNAKILIERGMLPRGANVSYWSIVKWFQKYRDSFENELNDNLLIGEVSTSVEVVSTYPEVRITFCDDCGYHIKSEIEESDTCRAAIGLKPSGQISFVRKHEMIPPERRRCIKINKAGKCGMFQAKRGTETS
jgi:hypothetical protein